MDALARLLAIDQAADPDEPLKTFAAQVTVVIDEFMAAMLRRPDPVGYLRSHGFTEAADEMNRLVPASARAWHT